jgi:hypothetical protein
MARALTAVVAGLVLAIHVLQQNEWDDVDARHKAGHDDRRLARWLQHF